MPMPRLPSCRFRALLEPVPHGGCFVIVPPEIAAAAGIRYGDRVRGAVSGVKYRSSLAKYSGVFHMGVHKTTLAVAGAVLGDEVEVTIERDTAPLPSDRVPRDLARALKAVHGAAAAFAALAPSRRREYVGSILEAKTAETRERRISKVLVALAKQPLSRKAGGVINRVGRQDR
jgi:hypothetical protein